MTVRFAAKPTPRIETGFARRGGDLSSFGATTGSRRFRINR
jgi:hypothetical protein